MAEDADDEKIMISMINDDNERMNRSEGTRIEMFLGRRNKNKRSRNIN